MYMVRMQTQSNTGYREESSAGAYGTNNQAGSNGNAGAYGADNQAESNGNAGAYGADNQAGSNGNAGAYGTDNQAGSNGNTGAYGTNSQARNAYEVHADAVREIPVEEKKQKKPGKAGKVAKKAVAIVVSAALFGGVAAGTFQGVNYLTGYNTKNDAAAANASVLLKSTEINTDGSDNQGQPGCF